MRRQALRLAIVCMVALLADAAGAHDVMGTVIFLDLGRTRVHLEVELPVDELRLALGRASRPGIVELPGTHQELTTYLLAHLRLTTPEGAAFSLSARPLGVILHDQRNWLRIAVDAAPPGGASPRDFVLTSDLINHQVVSHHVFVFLRQDLETGQLGDPVYLDRLHYQRRDVRVRRAPGSLGVGLWAVFRLGASHIAEGSDHLLFLFTLLLPAGVVLRRPRSWGGRRPLRECARDVVRVVTAFTLGHSATLLIAALGLVTLPSALVESLIALSVLVSAVHAIVPIFPRREAWVALGFGLVHGLGFATALSGLGVDEATLALTIFGFNFGVEAMQLLLVCIALPWIFLLQGTRLGTPFRIVGGVLSGVAAVLWLCERALGMETPLLDWVDAPFERGRWLLAGLATLAVLGRGLDAVAARGGSTG